MKQGHMLSGGVSSFQAEASAMVRTEGTAGRPGKLQVRDRSTMWMGQVL